jgi:hypothetical protein
MQPVITLALALGLAYLVGDFPLQPPRLPNTGKRIWAGVVRRGLLHWVLILLLVSLFASRNLSWRFGIAAGFYVILHLAIGIGQQLLIARQRISDSTKVFVVDQVVHVAILLGFTIFVTGINWQDLRNLVGLSESAKYLVLAGAVVYISVIFAGGYLIRYMTKGLVTDDHTSGQEPVEQLENAGMYIGWLERFLIVTAVVLRSPTLIGLILTGKSIARFPEMKEPRFVEYFLIGTLLSFTLALLGGLLLLRIWKGTISLQP